MLFLQGWAGCLLEGIRVVSAFCDTWSMVTRIPSVFAYFSSNSRTYVVYLGIGTGDSAEEFDWNELISRGGVFGVWTRYSEESLGL